MSVGFLYSTSTSIKSLTKKSRNTDFQYSSFCSEIGS
jgi:hypothetical protein